MLCDLRCEFFHAFASQGGANQNRNLERGSQLSGGALGSAQIRLVDEDNVRRLQKTSFCRLDIVSPARMQDDHHGMGDADDLNLRLTHSDRLDEQRREARQGERGQHRLDPGRQAPDLSPGGERPDVDVLITGVLLHSDPIT